MVGFPTDKQPPGSAWWDECPGTSADFETSAIASHQVGNAVVSALCMSVACISACTAGWSARSLRILRLNLA